MKPTAYLETTVVSYLTAKPARDLLRAAEQEVTREWWGKRSEFELYISQLVIGEASLGDAEAAQRRLTILREIDVLDMTVEAAALAHTLVTLGGLPIKAGADALHIAVAAVHGVDFVVSWNCTHIANARTRGKIEGICRDAGYAPPMLCTPRELLEE